MEDQSLPPHIGLQPQAVPTDQYKAPWNPRKLAGQGTLQLADALRGFSPDAEKAYQQLLPVYIGQQERKADQYNETHQFQNMMDLRAAVARGELPDYNNPWLRVRLNNLVAVTEARNGAKQAFNDLRNSSVFHGDSVADVNKFLTERLQPLMNGKDSWQAAAVAPVLAQEHDRILNEWTASRGAERMDEAHTATGATVLQSVSDHMGDSPIASPEGTQKLPGLIADLQTHYAHLTNVVDKATASKWISDAAFQAGRIYRSADLTRAILDGVQGQDGIQLSKLADNRAELGILPREIEQLTLADVRTHNEVMEQKAAGEALNLMQKAPEWQKAQGAASLMETKVPKEVLEKESPLVVAELYRRLAAVSADYQQNRNSQFMLTIEPSVGRAMREISEGKFDQNGYIKLGTVLGAAGDPGKNAMETVTRMWLQQRGIAEGITRPEAISQVTFAAQAGTLRTDMVMDLNARGLLDKSDTIKYMQLAAAVQADNGKGSPVVQSALAKLHRQVEAGYLNGDGLILPGRDTTEKMKLAVDGATDAFLQRYYTDLAQRPGWANASLEEQQKQTQDLVDWASKHAGGLTDAERMKRFPFEQQKDKPLNLFNPISDIGKLPKDEARIQAGDPMQIDRQTVKSLHHILSFDVEKPPLHKMLQWSEQNRDPLGDGVHSGQALLDRTLEMRSKQSFLPDEKWGNVDVTKGTVNGSRLAFTQMREEQKTWAGAMNRLQELKPVAVEAQQKLQQISNQFLKTGKIDHDTQQEANRLTLQYLAFLDLRKHLGYTPDEVKNMGEGAWRFAPMFANPLDLKQRGNEAAKNLGLPETLWPAFAAEQLRLLKAQRNQKPNPGDEQ